MDKVPISEVERKKSLKLQVKNFLRDNSDNAWTISGIRRELFPKDNREAPILYMRIKRVLEDLESEGDIEQSLINNIPVFYLSNNIEGGENNG